MIDATEHGKALRGIAGRLCNMPDRFVRDPIALVDWHRDMARELRGLADGADPQAGTPRPVKPLPSIGRGEVIGPNGRSVPVERRRARA